MPKIPRYTKQVVPSAMPVPGAAPQATALGTEAFGGGLAKGFSDVAKILDAERKSVDMSMFLGSKTQADQLEVDLMDNQETGALTKKGKDAFGVDVSTLEAFDAGISKIEQSMGSDAQKAAFRQMAAQKRVGVSKSLQRHIYGETTAYAAETNKAALESTANAIARNFQDPERVEQERRFGEAAILSDPGMRGAPPGAMELRKAKWNSVAYSTVAEQLLSAGSAESARQYLGAHQGDLTPGDYAKLEAKVRPAADWQVGETVGQELFRKHASDPNPLVALQELDLDPRVATNEHAKKAAAAFLTSRIGLVKTHQDALAKQSKENADREMADFRLKNKGVPIAADMVLKPETLAALRENNGEAYLSLFSNATRINEEIRKEGSRKDEDALMGWISEHFQNNNVFPKTTELPKALVDNLQRSNPEKAEAVQVAMRTGNQADINTAITRITQGRAEDDYQHRHGSMDQYKTYEQLLNDRTLLLKTDPNALFNSGRVTEGQRNHLVNEQQRDKDKEKGIRSYMPNELSLVKAVWKGAGVYPTAYPAAEAEYRDFRNVFISRFGRAPEEGDMQKMAPAVVQKVVVGGVFSPTKRQFQTWDRTSDTGFAIQPTRVEEAAMAADFKAVGVTTPTWLQKNKWLTKSRQRNTLEVR